MKSLLFFLPVVCLCFTSCEKDDLANPEGILGTWRLVEVLADPGDGSGTFQPIASDRRITFASDGTYTATGDLCQFNTEVGGTSSGLYFPDDNRIEPENCFTIGGTPITYEQDNRELIINYLCIEPCRHKYRKE